MQASQLQFQVPATRLEFTETFLRLPRRLRLLLLKLTKLRVEFVEDLDDRSIEFPLFLHQET